MLSDYQINKLEYNFFESFQIKTDLSKFISDNITKYYIHKSNSKMREVIKPHEHLKQIHKWIYNYILSEYNISECCHSYVKGKSIFTNASMHIGSNIIISLDIKDFFNSIKSEDVTSIFNKLGFSRRTSDRLSMLCTNDGHLCQGFSTSPSLSNIYFSKIDQIIFNFCNVRGLIYTRYSDDITISGELNEYEIKQMINFVTKTLKDYNLQINTKKTKVQKSITKKVTGIIVYKDHIDVPNRYKKVLQKEIYFCKKFGVNKHLLHTNNFYKINYKSYLYGLAYYIYNTDKKLATQYLNELNEIDFLS